MPPQRGLSSEPAKRRGELLAIPAVRTWHDARALRSLLSADNDLRKLGLTLYRIGLDPTSVVEIAKHHPEKLEAALIQYASGMKRDGRGDAHITKTLGALKNYLSFRKADFDSFPKLSAPAATTTLERERVPTQQELGQVLQQLSLRSRVAALFIAHSGLRPSVLAGYQGKNGLTLAALPDLDLAEMRLRELPFAIRVPTDLSKIRKAYTSFGTAQLAEVLIAYLKERRASGESLSGSSPVVARAAPDKLRGVSRVAAEGTGTRFMVTHALTDEIAETLHASQPEGVTWRVYVLRSYCSTRLLLAEGEGRITRDLREAILGHDLGVGGRYTLGKPWGQEILADARKRYAASSEFLETTVRPTQNLQAAMRTEWLVLYGGFSREEALAITSKNPTDAEIMALAVGRRGSAAQVAIEPAGRTGEERVIPASATNAHLKLGWSAKCALGNDVVVVWPGPAPPALATYMLPPHPP